MSERRWTPGPWRVCTETKEDYARQVGGHYDVGMDGSDGYTIAALIGDIPELQRCEHANAHLIAASPDLYEALEAMVDHFGVLEDNPMLHEDAVAVSKRARAALAKARGET